MAASPVTATVGGAPPRARVLGAVAVLALLGAAIHVPRLALPFGVADVNAGVYFGLFVRQIEEHGFFALRGVPLGPERIPYLNHPPGLTWLFALLGTGEEAFRLPTAVAAVVAAAALLALLRPAVGTGPALIAGVCLLVTPSAVLYSQASYETMVLAFGLVLWLATLRVEASRGGVRRAWRALQVATAFGGVWIDWSFAFFCLGLVPLVWHRAPRATLARLWVPALAAGLAAGTVLWWQQWAIRGPLVRPDLGELSLREMASQVLDRPAVGTFVRQAGATMLAACSLPLALAAAGIALLARRAPRLAAALLVAGLGQPLVFATHATDHVHFFCYTAALLAGAAAGLTALRDARLRIAGALALAAVTAGAWWAGVRAREASDTPFFRDFGTALTTAAHATGVGGDPVPFAAVTNLPYYPYYVDTSAVLLEVNAALYLAPHRRNPLLPHGYHYLWFRDFGGASAAGVRAARPGTELEGFLGAFPRARMPALEGTVGAPAGRAGYEIREAWLVLVPPAFTLALCHGADRAAEADALAAALRTRTRGLVFEHVVAVPADGAGEAIAAATHVVLLWSAALAPRPQAWAQLAAALGLHRHGVLVGADGTPIDPRLEALSGDGALAIVASEDAPEATATAVVRSFEQLAVRLSARRL